MIRIATFLLIALSLVPRVAAAQDTAGLGPLYERVADDLQAGKPLVIVAHYGMWQAHPDEPERNLNWGVYYGHATMLKRARTDKHIARNFTHHDWRLVFERRQAEDPIRTLVFAQTVRPNKRWRDAGVDQPIQIYLVMYAHADQQDAALAATRNFRQAEGEEITLDDGTGLRTAEAQAVGYFGHNFFYDYDEFRWDGLAGVSGTPPRPVGIFAVGCKTARVPGFDSWFGPNTFTLLYSKTLMASEGYSTLALADGLLRHLDSRELVDHADATYRYFQKLGDPDRRVGRPFVSQGYKLAP